MTRPVADGYQQASTLEALDCVRADLERCGELFDSHAREATPRSQGLRIGDVGNAGFLLGWSGHRARLGHSGKVAHPVARVDAYGRGM